MKLVVLVDNNTLIDHYYLDEPGVCYYIEDEGQRLLLDVGYSDIFIKNAKLMGIDLTTVSTIAISHGHNDHTRGLQFLAKEMDLKMVNLVAHPDAFKTKIFENESIGSPFDESQLQTMCSLQLSKTPIKISPNITFLGEIPSSNDFEHRQHFGCIVDPCHHEMDVDYVLDDSALVYQSRTGLFIITGCSHSGICNIVEYAKQVCNETKVVGIIGGFHLFERSKQLSHTVEYFVKNEIRQLYPCHCVSFIAKSEINQAIPVHEVGVSLTLEID